jgi:hypothetical protein
MSPEITPVIVLIIMFVIGTILPSNLGVMGFVAALLVGTTLGGLSADNIFDGFPVNLFVLLAGITLLFAIAQNNGTIDLLTDWSLSLVRGNIGFSQHHSGTQVRPYPAPYRRTRRSSLEGEN